jgi:hypothetical protein
MKDGFFLHIAFEEKKHAFFFLNPFMPMTHVLVSSHHFIFVAHY